ncbi:site-specific recombinase, phage integrase family protein [Listeria fleischmannii FSL S10-1203]|uniref:Site-specific recombinase, phage integrase family protein n=1 Tax=Listeria fleischmannii FSL S10-1203 TaxID=1265822 RepID=W7DYI9_9LIST|nr:site-specific recombinase, phage integrase family protein [Listeria fleischmannii FSL S10-1203]
MNFVQPIRSVESIEKIKDYLLSQSQRNYILFILGINVGLRIGDLIALKVSDVKSNHIIIKEQKTNKSKQIKLTKQAKKSVNIYIADMKDDDYLFPSRNGMKEHISRFTAYKIMKDIQEQFKLENLGAHTLRKTFGYHFYKKNKMM